MLEIDRLSLQVRAAVAPERAERLARRLRDAAVAGIERDRYALAPAGAPGYLFVERLAVHCEVSSEWDDAAIGAAVARALAAALERSAAMPQTLAFRDRVELLAAFYVALAEGRAWERWWFEAFDGLRPLQASAALRTSVINEDRYGVAALARLTGTALGSVLALLAAGDARRLVEWFARRSATAAAPVAALWEASASRRDGVDADTGLLAALVAAERAESGSAGALTLEALRGMTALRGARARGEHFATNSCLDVPQEILRGWLARLGHDANWLRCATEVEAARIIGELAADADESPRMPSETAPAQDALVGERLYTKRGGVFVLLKALDWISWPALWRSRVHDPEADALVRSIALAVALRALDPRDTVAGLADPALRAAFGVDRPLTLLGERRRALRRIVAGGIRPAADALLGEFSRRIPGLAGATHAYLRRNALALPASVEIRGATCHVRMGRAPVDILLVLAGAKHGRVVLPGGTALGLEAETM